MDTLNPVATSPTTVALLPAFLSSLLISPSISLLATYHLDIPSSEANFQAIRSTSHLPPVLSTLTYLATAILHTSRVSQIVAQKKALARSLDPPVFGLDEHREGLLRSVNRGHPRHASSSRLSHSGRRGSSYTPSIPGDPHDGEESGVEDDALEIVVRMEMRRRSGRGIIDTFVLRFPLPGSSSSSASASASSSSSSSSSFPATAPSLAQPLAKPTLLEDHPAIVALESLASPSGTAPTSAGANAIHPEDDESLTFKLGLTEKEKREREAVVLPHYRAQRDGNGNGVEPSGSDLEEGRILYEMGAEDFDDFDEEEDEI